MWRIGLPLAALALLVACQTTSQGIGGSSPGGAAISDAKGGIEVLKLDFDAAIRLAEKAAKRAYDRVAQSSDQSTIYIVNRSLLAGDARADVTPVLIRNTETNEVGVTYDVKSSSTGAVNPSLFPGYIAGGFFDKLKEVVAEENIARVTFRQYERIEDKGVTTRVASDVPQSYEAFARYLDGKRDADPFEGIWVDAQNIFTLGLIRDETDPQYRHKLFIIDSKEPGWRPGEVKLKFRSLANGFSLGTYYAANKREEGLPFQATPNILIAMAAQSSGRVMLNKVYPGERQAGGGESGGGTGSAWHVGGGYFVTNAHVVEGGKTFTLHLNRATYAARQIAVDKKSDLAIVKVELGSVKIPALPLAADVRQGRNVFAIGYPLISTLGESVKITNGIVSSLEGIRGDPTQIGFTAPVQPGNSGGPLLDDEGRIVGIVVSRVPNQQNVNYAIKVDYLTPLLRQVGAPVVFGPSGKKIDVCEVYCSAVGLLDVR